MVSTYEPDVTTEIASVNSASVPGNARTGRVPVAVVMLSLNEEHNMEAVLENLAGWASEVFLLDSFSVDDTVGIALKYGVQVAQRRFRNFGDQWNFAIHELPITAPWTMKLDPDERLTDELKAAIGRAIASGEADGFRVRRRLWFMSRPLPISHMLVRIWRTGRCRFTDVAVNEHPIVDGVIGELHGDLLHQDSPNLEHWLDKQNRYSTVEAVAAYQHAPLADHPHFFGSRFQRRMWIKRHLFKLPFRYPALFLYHYVLLGAWRAGWVGYAWSRLRSDVYRLREYKLREIELTGRLPSRYPSGTGGADPRVPQYD